MNQFHLIISESDRSSRSACLFKSLEFYQVAMRLMWKTSGYCHCEAIGSRLWELEYSN